MSTREPGAQDEGAGAGGQRDGGRGPLSSPELLALHGVRILGAPRLAEIASRFRLPLAVVREQLLDDQALGLVTRYDVGEVTWSLTERGRAAHRYECARLRSLMYRRAREGQRPRRSQTSATSPSARPRGRRTASLTGIR